MTVALTIDGVSRRTLLRRGSLRIHHAVNERSTGSIALIDPAGVYRPDVGDPVIIQDGATTIFGGTVDSEEERKPLGTIALDESVPLVDYHQLADRRIVAETYENQTAGYIASDIITKYLAVEGITAGTIQPGPTITKAVFNYLPASQCFDELAKLTGFQWRINANKTLDLFDRATFTGTAITEASGIRDVVVRRHREGYRNRQYVRAGKGITDIQTNEKPTPKPDSVTRTFVLRYPVAKVPTVKVNAVVKTVGIKDIDTGKNWYWNKDSNTITQDSAGTVLADTDVLEITYQGYYPIMVQSDDEAAQSERLTAEGSGSGIYEAVEDRPDIDENQAASDLSEGLLRRYAKIFTVVEFSVEGSIYEPGQIVNANLPTHSVSGDYLISEIQISDRVRQDEALTYRVKALSGEAVGGWARFFRELVRKQQTFAIRENEVLVRNLKLYDTASLREGHTVNVVGLTQTPNAAYMTINVRGLTQTEDPSYATYNAVGVTQTLDATLNAVNLYGWTDPASYDYSVPVWAVNGGGDAAPTVEVVSFAPVTSVGAALVSYSEVA